MRQHQSSPAQAPDLEWSYTVQCINHEQKINYLRCMGPLWTSSPIQFYFSSFSVPKVIEVIDTVTLVNGTLKGLPLGKKGTPPDVSKSSAQLRLHGESGKFRSFCLRPRAATSALFVSGGGSVCKLVIGCSCYHVGMLTPDKHFRRPPSELLEMFTYIVAPLLLSADFKLNMW